MNILKVLRTRAGLLQKEVADSIGVDRTTYLRYEKGETEPDHNALRKLSKLFNISIDELLQNNSPASSAVRIPVLGRVAAGIPLEAIEDIIDWEEITPEMARSGQHVALKIHGNSMEPKISEGDVVIVRLQPEVENGEIAVVFVNGDEATCKRIKKTPEGVMLISLNPDYEPMFYSAHEVEQLPVRILGKVVELRSKF